jgi:hypothetical protein
MNLLLQVDSEFQFIEPFVYEAYKYIERDKWLGRDSDYIPLTVKELGTHRHAMQKAVGNHYTPIGGVEYVNFYYKFLTKRKYDIPIFTYNHPDFHYLKLKTFKEIREENLIFPMFIKSKDLKKVSGVVIENSNEFLNFSLLYHVKDEDLFFYINDKDYIYDFSYELRIYVDEGKVIGMGGYYGNPLYVFKKGLEEFINDFIDKSVSMPRAYSFDVGYDEKSLSWKPIEINDFYALGNYGCNIDSYLKASIKRWWEIVNGNEF